MISYCQEYKPRKQKQNYRKTLKIISNAFQMDSRKSKAEGESEDCENSSEEGSVKRVKWKETLETMKEKGKCREERSRRAQFRQKRKRT
jgi:hypothetical protein